MKWGRLMRTFRGVVAGLSFAGAVFAGALVGVAPAEATTFDWSFSGAGVSGSGQFVGTLKSGTTYGLTGISGTVFDPTLNGPVSTIVALDPYAAADQQLFFNTANLTSFGGISFSALGLALITYNIFTDGGSIHYGLLNSITNPGGFANPNRPIDFNVSLATPLPSPLVLFGSALGLLMLLGSRSRNTYWATIWERTAQRSVMISGSRSVIVSH